MCVTSSMKTRLMEEHTVYTLYRKREKWFLQTHICDKKSQGFDQTPHRTCGVWSEPGFCPSISRVFPDDVTNRSHWDLADEAYMYTHIWRNFIAKFLSRSTTKSSAKFKSVVLDYFNIKRYKSFSKAMNRINQNYLKTYGNGLNITENSAVPA